ncbi:MAG TPA: glycosyltransferase family 9 protein [Melioribacteraceae bacterium]|nr:glycosyltransferase family 9 protein [Melioribacteraceae bacterium]
MSFQKKIKNRISSFLEKLLSAEELHYWQQESPAKFLVVRQHNQFGDMLASVSLFRAIKETYPSSTITLIASPENYFALTKNPLIDDLFVYNKSKLYNPFYLFQLYKKLRNSYDLAIVPATVAISTTSCLLAGLSRSRIKVGPRSLDGAMNQMSYVFNYRIDLNWKKNPDAHVSDFILDIIRPAGIRTRNYQSQISFDEKDKYFAADFIKKIGGEGKILIGIHPGAGKPQNRWPLENFIELIKRGTSELNSVFYITGSRADKEILEYFRINLPKTNFFTDRPISQLAALVASSTLFITNDTGVMHVAGATATPQISLFGPTNPFNWAPFGNNKFFIRKSELMNDISVDEVFQMTKNILGK